LQIEIGEILLVGDSTRIPKVRELLQKLFSGKQLNISYNPNEPVVCGAAIIAAGKYVERVPFQCIESQNVQPFSSTDMDTDQYQGHARGKMEQKKQEVAGCRAQFDQVAAPSRLEKFCSDIKEFVNNHPSLEDKDKTRLTDEFEKTCKCLEDNRKATKEVIDEKKKELHNFGNFGNEKSGP